ncbi:uncharacterized protein ALTATR162_LOCUS6506 [Alternaria atra]|uniref:Thioredoxin domain-containing protein n=1 Tax=Alternaria atra TaxID=119953 RepID=A0A8J2I9Q8_9PLEO|nr:uncharacterized protein ALTATR162_LOCUS6506 [Alternaria atra]CAG5163609.1 unnamed protein product [Alternaria atra]
MIRPTLLSTFRLNALPTTNKRVFSLLNPKSRSHTNRVFDPIRQPNDLHTLTLLNAADNRSLITFWTASWCQTCQAIKPLIKQLIEEEKIGEREGGLGFVEVLMDSTLIEDLPIKYRISSMPTLLAFSRQEAQFDTRLTRPEEMRNKDFLREWLSYVFCKKIRSNAGPDGLQVQREMGMRVRGVKINETKAWNMGGWNVQYIRYPKVNYRIMTSTMNSV